LMYSKVKNYGVDSLLEMFTSCVQIGVCCLNTNVIAAIVYLRAMSETLTGTVNLVCHLYWSQR
jgi:hypothetical protein